MTESLGDAFLDPVTAAFFGAVAQELAPTGLALSLIPADTIGERSAARDLAIDAALIYACAGDLEAVRSLQRRNLPIVSVDREPEAGGASIRLDERAGGRLAAQHLIDLGHTDIAVFTMQHLRPGPAWADDPRGQLPDYVAEERLRGVLEATDAAGLEIRLFHVKDNRDLYVLPGAAALVADPNRPTGVVCFSDTMAAALSAAAQSAGLAVPQDLSIVGYDDSRLASAITPALTTVRQDFVAKGRAAARALVGAIDAVRGGAQLPLPKEDVIVPVELVVRESTGAPRAT
jgi:DNA-binding LacI/PurR family transcriptional regulator